MLTGRTDPEVEAPVLWPPHEKRKLPRKDPDVGKIEGTRRRGRQRMRWLDSVLKVTSMSFAKLREAVEVRSDWRALVHGVTKSQTRLND